MTVVAGQIIANDLADFFVAQGFPAVPSKDGKLPAGPDKVIVVTRTGGPGFTMDQLFDNVSFQLRFRGEQNDADSCEDMAWDADYLLVPPPLQPPLSPGMIGSQFVNKVQRIGSPPTFLLLDSARRTHMTGNYVLTVARA